MNSRERFRLTMSHGAPDHPPYFEEGIRSEVLDAWRTQGLEPGADLEQLFPRDLRVELEPDLDPIPELRSWPTCRADLGEFERCLDPADPARLPLDWKAQVAGLKDSDAVRMLRVHRGFFLSMGVRTWDRFEGVVVALGEDPGFVHEMMGIWGRFTAALAERVLGEIAIDAAVFNEPIGGNEGPLISPKMYEEFVLRSYEPLLSVLRDHGVRTLVLRTYANARLLVPTLLRWGFDCLWACEVEADAMDYRSLRREFGRDLKLIGGIDLDALRSGPAAIDAELDGKVPVLLAEGGYAPLADGRVRADVPFEHYAYYRRKLAGILGM